MILEIANFQESAIAFTNKMLRQVDILYPCQHRVMEQQFHLRHGIFSRARKGTLLSSDILGIDQFMAIRQTVLSRFEELEHRAIYTPQELCRKRREFLDICDRCLRVKNEK